MPCVTIRRDEAVQRWPVEKNEPLAAASTAVFRSASSSTTSGFLPPISSWNFFIFAPATQAADLQLIMNTGLLTIKVGDAVFIEQQLWDFNAGVGPAAGFAATTAATTSIAFAANGITQGENFWKLYELGFAIEEGEQIDAVMSWPAAVTITTATVITLQLEGRYTNNVVG